MIAVEVPPLLAMQMDSYRNFLEANGQSDKLGSSGLHGVFSSVFPIFSGHAENNIMIFSQKASALYMNKILRKTSSILSFMYVRNTMESHRTRHSSLRTLIYL